jgi:hypothetical protein
LIVSRSLPLEVGCQCGWLLDAGCWLLLLLSNLDGVEEREKASETGSPIRARGSLRP